MINLARQNSEEQPDVTPDDTSRRRRAVGTGLCETGGNRNRRAIGGAKTAARKAHLSVQMGGGQLPSKPITRYNSERDHPGNRRPQRYPGRPR